MKHLKFWAIIIVFFNFVLCVDAAILSPKNIENLSKTQNLPSAFIGTFSGKLSISADGKEKPELAAQMQISIYPSKKTSEYEYTIIYASNGSKDIRAYVLTVIDSAKGIAIINERNGIVIPISIHGNKLVSNFTISNQQITMITTFSKLMAQMELLAGAKTQTSKSIPENAASDTGFTVIAKILNIYQSATLIREPEPQVSKGKLIQLGYMPSKFTNAHRVAVWLPPNYQPNRMSDVIYMHDGQMLFDAQSTWNHQEWGIDELIANTHRNAIVVGIWNDGINRSGDYFPQKVWTNYLTQADRDSIINHIGGEIPLFGPVGPHADNYLKFITQELKPYIDSAFMPYPSHIHTHIAGASMGGLISIYAICEYPEIFGSAICLSTHWPGTSYLKYPNTPIAFQQYLNQNLPNPKHHKIFFAHGTGYLDSLYTPHQKNVDKIMSKKGYKANSNWKTIVYLNADHKESEWQKQMVDALNFVMPIKSNKE